MRVTITMHLQSLVLPLTYHYIHYSWYCTKRNAAHTLCIMEHKQLPVTHSVCISLSIRNMVKFKWQLLWWMGISQFKHLTSYSCGFNYGLYGLWRTPSQTQRAKTQDFDLWDPTDIRYTLWCFIQNGRLTLWAYTMFDWVLLWWFSLQH